MKLILTTSDEIEHELTGYDYKGPEFWIPYIGNVTEEQFNEHFEKEYRKNVSEKFIRFILSEFIDLNWSLGKMNEQIQKIVSIIGEANFKISSSIIEKEN